MRTGTRRIAVASAICLAVVLVGASQGGRADARGARSKAGLRVIAINVDEITDVALNQVIEIRFNTRVTRSTLTNGSIVVVPRDSATAALGEPRPGVLTRRGNRVRFIPVLPTHAADLGSPQGTPFDNGSFRPGADYRVLVTGGREKPSARSAARGRLTRSATADFTTADGSALEPLFVPEDFAENRRPRVLFTNPPDTVLRADFSYALPGGTPEVPTAASVTLSVNGVPLDPTTVLAPGAVELILVDGPGDEPPGPVAGEPLLVQDRNRTSLVFRPSRPLAAFSTFALRIDESVTELTGGIEVSDHPERARLRSIYGWLAAGRAFQISQGNPDPTGADLPSPPEDLIPDWPWSAARNECKENLLEIGDTRPWEIDPRVHVIFTTGSAELSVPGPGSIDATGATRGSRRLAQVTRVETPLGLQGTAGAGGNVIVPFELVDQRGRAAVVELQYGFDTDANGTIDDHEFRTASLDWLDARATHRNRASPPPAVPSKPVFEAAPDTGRSHAIAWASTWDVGRAAFRLGGIAHTAQGREIEDPDDPDSPLLEPGRGGIVLRVRTVRGRKRATNWVRTAPFALVNNVAPSLTIDDAVVGDPVLVSWTAFDGDSEDFNGNGTLDYLDGEDVNLDGWPDFAPVGVAFDFHVLDSAEDPRSLTRSELAALEWMPCTRAVGVGDPDDGVPSSPLGVRHTFAWDAATDLVAGGERVILRARPFDENREHGPWVYRVQVLTLGD